jgi:hypothetical protein
VSSRPFGPPSSSLRSRDYSSAAKGAVLTDATILRYILAGHYGEEKRLAALANMPKKRKKREKKDAEPPSLSLALEALNKLTKP